MNRAIRSFLPILAVLAVAGLWFRPAVAYTTILAASKDNTLYEDPSGTLSNGSGQYIFTGHTASVPPLARRALLAFDLTCIPPGSTVTSATLTLYLSMSISGNQPVSIHRSNDSWGEGASDAVGAEGGGTAAEPGDATWIHRFYDTTSWATAGGDFDATASATIVVSNAFGAWSWGSAGTASDVQAWVDDPSANHGWIVLGDESLPTTAKRFGSRENPIAVERPVLTVEFTPPASAGAGSVAQSGPDALRLTEATGTDLTLTWGESCEGDPDYAVYEGTLGSPASHVPSMCIVPGGSTVTITPEPGNRFFLVVPRNALREGSYGAKTGGIQRPPSGSACVPQSVLACQCF